MAFLRGLLVGSHRVSAPSAQPLVPARSVALPQPCRVEQLLQSPPPEGCAARAPWFGAAPNTVVLHVTVPPAEEGSVVRRGRRRLRT